MLDKRAQTEIIGLTFVVLILLIGFFIYIILRSKGGLTSNVESIQYNTLASLQLSAILNTHVNECGFSTAILVKNCLKGRGCTGYSGDLCDLLNNYLSEIFNKSFDKWGRRYRLYTSNSYRDKKIDFPDDNKRRCKDTEDTLGVAVQKIPLTPGSAELRLEICE